MSTLIITDVTLRDGNHAASHQLGVEEAKLYCAAIDAAGVPIVEVGHGNGLGASSLQLGESKDPDRDVLLAARSTLKKAKLEVFVIPGFATIEKDLRAAIEIGVDVVRVASHCTEADITERHIRFVRESGRTALGVLMMSHMISANELLEQARKSESYGAEAVIIMDSSGNYLPSEVTERVRTLVDGLGIPVGFHAHGNLGMGIANSLAAFEAGASYLDGSARGFGAGAGNAQIEVLVAVLQRIGVDTGIDLFNMLDAVDAAEAKFAHPVPYVSSVSLVSGLAGVFSGFAKPVKRIAAQFGVDPREVFFELGRRKVVAGQEDLILEVASDLAKRKEKGVADEKGV
jgi:4-hydroxy 2-oxovalerate aldolase